MSSTSTEEKRNKQREVMRRWRALNPEKEIEAQRRYRKNNPEACRENQRRWRSKNKEKATALHREWCRSNPDKLKEYRLKHRKENPVRYLLASARRRCRVSGLSFLITERDIQIPETCPILGIPLVFHHGVHGAIDGSPSIDRIDTRLGYEPGNVWVISHRANRLKSDATLDELELIVASVRARMAR